MNTWKWLLVLALAGCATLHGGDRYWLKPGAAAMSDATSLIHYGNYVRALDASERDRETERVRAQFGRDRSDFHRLQYVLALSSVDASVGDRRLALQLLEPLLDGKHDADLAALAGFVNAQLNAQATLLAGQQQAQKRADELEKKLDAVKDIERSLLRREKGKL